MVRKEIWCTFKCIFWKCRRSKAGPQCAGHAPLTYILRVLNTFNVWLVDLADMKPEDQIRLYLKTDQTNESGTELFRLYLFLSCSS